MAKSNLQLPLPEKDLQEGQSQAVSKSAIGVFCSPSSNSNSAHLVYFPAEDPPSDLPQTSTSQELLPSIMSDDHVSALERALSKSEARYIETQKQIKQLASGFQQLQQLLL